LQVNPTNITFRVVDNDGCPVCGALFYLVCDCESGRYMHAISNKNGTVMFCNVCPGSYFLTQLATAFGYEFDEDAEERIVTVTRNGCVKIDDRNLCLFTVINARIVDEDDELEPPTVEPVDADDVVISGTGEACCKVEVIFPGCRPCCVVVNRDGNWRLDVPCDIVLAEGDSLCVAMCCDSRPRSEEVVVTVGGDIDPDPDPDPVPPPGPGPDPA